VSRILVLDDDADTLEILTCVLEASGHTVTTATNGRDGLEARPESYDAIILDLQMPEMNGWEFTRRLKALSIEVPVILVSGDHDVERAAAELSAFGYVSKPVATNHVLHVVTQALTSKRSAN